MAVVPIVRGLILCEQVVVHPSRNLTLAECFRALKVAGLPNAAKPFFAVATLANGFASTPIRIRVIRLDTLEPIYAARTTLTFAGRLDELRLKVRIEQCVFPGVGDFEAELWAGEELIAQTPFTVRPLEV